MFINKQFLLIILMIFIDLILCAVYKRKKIVQHGDLMIGALIPVHEQPSFNSNDALTLGSKRKCGVIRDQYGVQRVEALLYMLDKINNKTKTKFLPGIQLGLEIRDECWETSIALEETIDFIKDTIASDNDQLIDSSSNSSTSLAYEDLNGESINSVLHEKCQLFQRDKQNQNKILSVIGPAGSSVAINVQNLLQLFDIPQIGYSATSRDLSDKKLFKTFLRVVPSDYLQVRAMIDVVVKMNWTYLFAIYTDGSYGQAGMEAFRNETSYLNICLALYEKIREYANDEDYEVVIKKMNQTSTAKVIVCFCYGETIRGLLGAMYRLNLKGRFIILGSDGWSDRIDVAKDYYEEAVGSLSLKAYSPVVTEFDDYFASLNPSNNLRNVWFTEYWEERFKCYIEEATMSKYDTPCKRKCPINFIQIGNNCYWFSSKNLNWADAQQECKQKYFDSNLIDLNNQDDLEQVFNYLEEKEMNEHLHKMHVRIKITQDPSGDLYVESGERKQFYEEYNSSEQTLKLRNCKVNSSKRKKSEYQLYENDNPESNNHVINETMSDFEASLGDEDVITFFNSKINQNFQCISVIITKNYIRSTKSNFSYCIELKNCNKRLPFVCKIEVNESKLNNSKSSGDFYPDSLRNYQQDPKMSYVMNSLLAVVHGLSRVHQNLCGGVSGLCDRMKNINGSELLKHVKESSFFGITGEKIYFDPNGDPPGRYVVLNVQREINLDDNSTRYIYKQVGNWNNDNRLNIDLNQLIFPDENVYFKSVCSEQCNFGHVKQIKQGGLKCCWNCKKCEDYSYVLDEHTCQECELGFWPNRNLTGCQKLSLTYLEWNEPASVFALFISCIGIVINTFITHIFIKYSNTCVVKSTTKELSFIILAGVYLSYLMTIPLILKPTIISCYLSRILPGFSLSLIYGALITKTNRIARILARSKKRIITKKPRFMSLTAQIIITCIIIAIECGLIIAAFVLEPRATIVNYPRRNEARLQCFDNLLSVLGPLGYNMFLVVLCTLYAIQTRNLPENFNEAKFIGFSMYTTCVIWIAFIPLYFGSDFKVVTLSLSTSFSATVILAFLFIPKVYIILFRPEKNQRSAFATSKDIRCHFGSNLQSQSVIDQEKSSSFHKASNGLFLLSGFAGMKANLKNDNINTNKNYINYTRYAYRPKFSYQFNEKSMDSIDTYTSIYQISDRSCQTSMDLIEPFVDRALKKRKIQKPETMSLIDQKELELEDKTDLNNNDKSHSVNNVHLGALGNFLFLPLIHNTSAPQSPSKNDNDPTEFFSKTNETSDNDKSNSNKNSDNVNHNQLSASSSASSYAKKKSFFKKSSKLLRKSSSKTKKTPSFDNDSIKNPDIIISKNNDNKVKNSLKILKLNNLPDKINEANIESDDISLPPSEVYKTETAKLLDISMESSSSVKENIEFVTNDNNNNNNINKNNNLVSDCESEFTIRMGQEDESLEEFKRIFIRNQNLVVNWDYVQSSDYL